jgi:hypothetical protein
MIFWYASSGCDSGVATSRTGITSCIRKGSARLWLHSQHFNKKEAERQFLAFGFTHLCKNFLVYDCADFDKKVAVHISVFSDIIYFSILST